MRLLGKMLDIHLLRPGTVHKITVAGASGRNSTAITLGSDGRRVVRIVASAAMYFKFGGSGVTAANTDSLLPANTVEYFDMWGDTHIAVNGTGDAHITEMGVNN